MELRHLRYFAAVAETRHFGHAAERLHIAQSALRQAVRQLEKELGVTLFARTTRQVSLTAAGEFFRVETERNLGAIEDSVRGVQRITGGQQGLVRIALIGTSALTVLPGIARAVESSLPEVALEIRADLLTPEQHQGSPTVRSTSACCGLPSTLTSSRVVSSTASRSSWRSPRTTGVEHSTHPDSRRRRPSTCCSSLRC